MQFIWINRQCKQFVNVKGLFWGPFFVWRNGMIIGIGVDIIELERVKKAVSSEAFLKRVFTPEEIK